MQVDHGGSLSIRVWDPFFGLMKTLVVTCMSHVHMSINDRYNNHFLADDGTLAVGECKI